MLVWPIAGADGVALTAPVPSNVTPTIAAVTNKTVFIDLSPTLVPSAICVACPMAAVTVIAVAPIPIIGPVAVTVAVISVGAVTVPITPARADGDADAGSSPPTPTCRCSGGCQCHAGHRQCGQTVSHSRSHRLLLWVACNLLP